MRLLLLLVALCSACTPALDMPAGAIVSCERGGDCPSGFRCDAQFGVCVLAEEGSGVPPALADGAVAPARAGRGALVHVTFRATQPLLAAPQVRLVAGTSTIPLQAAGMSGAAYRFTLAVTGDEPEGEWAVTADVVGSSGVVLRGALVGALTIDYTPPSIVSLDVDEAVLHDQRAWVDTTTVTLRSQVGAEPPSGVRVEGDVVGVLETAYADAISVELIAGDGPKSLSVTFFDEVGNGTILTRSLFLETTTPSSAIIIRSPEQSEIWINADAVPLLFSAVGAPPVDHAGFVASRDGGVTWVPVSTPGYYIMDGLTQDATNAVWLRERDVFGNMTPPSLQGVLVVHEDSQPPPPPIVPTIISGRLGSQVGVLALSAEPSGAAMRFEIAGPSGTVVVDGTALALLPELSPSGVTSYGVAAIDKADNRSTPVPVTVFDDPLEHAAFFCLGCTYTSFAAPDHRALFYTREDDSTHMLVLCNRDLMGGFSECGLSYVAPLTSPTTKHAFQQLGISGHSLIFEDISTNLAPAMRAIDLGADGVLKGGEAPVTLSTNAHCLGTGPTSIAYGGTPAGGKRPLVLRRLGADGIAGTADDLIDTLAPTANVSGSNPCKIAFDGRRALWRDERSGPALYLYDLGADHVPDGTDPGEVLLQPHAVSSFALSEGAILIQQGDYVERRDLGPDGLYGTADDGVTFFQEKGKILDMRGDKLLIETNTGGGLVTTLVDLSSRVVLTLNDSSRNDAIFSAALGPNYAIGSLNYLNIGSAVAFYSARQDAFAYRAGSFAPGRVGGAWSGDYLLVDGQLVDVARGGRVALFDPEPETGEPPDPDMDRGNVVWRAPNGELRIYQPGPDGLVGTADDIGPRLLRMAPFAPSMLAWPRIDERRVVWAELSAGWYGGSGGGALTSQLMLLDLGEDGLYDPSSEQPSPIPDLGGLRPLFPDLEGEDLVFQHRAGGTCPASRGSPILESCDTTLYKLRAGEGPVQLVGAEAPRFSLQLTEGMAIWSALVGDVWMLEGCALSTCATPIVFPIDRSTSAYNGVLADGLLVYQTGFGPGVLTSGADGVFGGGRSTDDVALRRPSPGGQPMDLLTPRLPFAGPLGIVVGGAVIPLLPRVTVSSSPQMNIPDIGGVTESIDVEAAAGQLIDDLTLEVAIDHPAFAHLTIILVAPSGEEVILQSGSGASGEQLLRYDFTNSASLFSFFAEPVAGTWTLEVRDDTAGSEGTLLSWRLETGG